MSDAETALQQAAAAKQEAVDDVLQDELEEPSIEVIDSDDDLVAVVDDAMEGEEAEAAEEVDTESHEESFNEPSEPLLRVWLRADESRLKHMLPELPIFHRVEVIRGIAILSIGTLLLQLWNMFMGIVNSAVGVRENTISWWHYLFSSGTDSFAAPYLSDPLGWAILILSFCLLLSTMPFDAKD